MQQNNISKTFLLIMTGLLVGFPALTTDAYLPSFPAMAAFFGASVSKIQMSLMTTMIGIAVGQLVIGPLSDRYGRIAPLICSLGLFAVATTCCLFSSDIDLFNLFRFIQGLACASGMVLSRAILTDSFTGRELVSSLSVNTAILGLTPATAPIIGGILLTFTPWQGIFVFLLILGILLLGCSTKLAESLPKEKRHAPSGSELLARFANVIKNKLFLKYVLVLSFSMAVLFAYIAASPFLFQTHYGLSPLAFSLLYGANAFASALGSLSASKFTNQYTALKTGSLGLLAMVLVTVLLLLFGAPVALFEGSLFILFMFNGLTFPPATTLAMELNRENAGTASAVLGAMSFLVGGIVTPLVGLGNILYATSIVMGLCASVTVWCCIGFGKEAPLRGNQDR